MIRRVSLRVVGPHCGFTSFRAETAGERINRKKLVFVEVSQYLLNPCCVLWVCNHATDLECSSRQNQVPVLLELSDRRLGRTFFKHATSIAM